MFFVLVVMPAGAALLKAASKVKDKIRQQRAWKKESEELRKRNPGLEDPMLCTVHVVLTKEEASAFWQTSAGEFLKNRRVSNEAAQFLNGEAV